MENWISVKDKQPEEGEPVWCFNEATRSIWIGGLSDVDDGALGWCNSYGTVWLRDDDSYDSDMECDDDYQVTHWQALPKPLQRASI